MMFSSGAWKRYGTDENGFLLVAVNTLINREAGGSLEAGKNTAMIDWRMLPFYDDVRLIRVWDSSWAFETPVYYFLLCGHRVFVLDGRARTIENVNELAQLRIDESTVLDYLRFFCGFRHGDRGEPFKLTENMNAFLGYELDERARLSVEKDLRPVELECIDNDGDYRCNGVMLHDDTLYNVFFKVRENGLVIMLDDERICSLSPD